MSMETTYSKPWSWKKGNRVSISGDSLTIKIGGNPDEKKAHRQSNKIKSTKYSAITFLPQNLLEQFRRIANFYFLIMTVVAIIIDSPVSPLTSLIPLVFVIAVTAAKQGYEDFLRFRADNMVNYSLVTVIRNGEENDIRCQDIMQGDLVKVPRDCDVPCDLVLLKSSDPHGKCFITTANLDGESNLKTLMVPKGFPLVEPNKLHTLGIIECEVPGTDLYSFNGKIELSSAATRISVINTVGTPTDNVLPLMAENLMLRGSRVKNTEWAIGCAVYTGQNTKLALNSKITRNKMSSSEKFINKFLVFFLVILISVVTVCYFLKRYYDQSRAAHNLYLGEPIANYQVSQFLQDYLSFLILFNYLIPISLYVTIEMHKFLGSFFMEWDPELYDEDTNQPCIVNTSDLNEELGQVRILFSDKTGTLTKNEMIFQQCSVAGRMYLQKGLGVQDIKLGRYTRINDFPDSVSNFFEALSVCHTVQVAGEREHVTDHKIDHSDTIDFNRINEEDSHNNFDSEQDDGDILELRPRTSNTSTSSRPISLFEFERMSMKNNITKRTTIGDMNPLLRRPVTCNANNEINFLGKSNTTNVANVNELPEIQCVRSVDKVTKRPISEILNHPFENQIRPVRPLSVVESTSSNHTSLNMDEFVDYNPNGDLAFLSNIGSGNLKRAISANDATNVDESNSLKGILTHRRTQSYASTPSKQANPSLARAVVSRNVSFKRHDSVRSITNTREYYAAPSYNEASLLERKESTMRKGVIKNVIDILDYQASSPDEKALVEACAKLGFVYTGDDDEIITVEVKKNFYHRTKAEFDTVDDGLSKFKSDTSTVSKYQRLAVLEFTSDRKRMSVVVKDQKGQIWLYTKGAESHVIPLCSKTTNHMLSMTQEHVNEFAKQGLRTLAVARKKLTTNQFTQFNNELHHANSSLTDRKALVDECQRKIETDLELLGATAVEDALQDNVKDTLESLRMAGIRVWVLTGDKVETALNIALSCGHIPENAFKYFITECKSSDQIIEHLNLFDAEMIATETGVFTLLIDGSSLAIALRDCANKFRDTAIKCRAVLCCRLSPLQKCEVVQLMKTVDEKPITAAIGDGANDVSMIQEAHVGLGIVGKEGRQAARCADYAFANFSMVKKVLLVHGHYYSQRLALLVLYFFYKNLVFMAIQLYFQANSMFSSQSVYGSLFLTLYNVVYTALPVLFISLTEKVYPEKILYENPELYQTIAKNQNLSWKYFIGWVMLGVYHGTVMYVFGYVIWSENPVILPTPENVSLSCFGTFLIHNVVVLVNLKLWMEAVYQSYLFIATIWFSILAFMVTTFVFNLFDLGDGNMLSVYTNLLGSPTFWLLSIVIIITALLPDFARKAYISLNLNVEKIFPGASKSARDAFFRRKIESTYL